MEALKQSYQAQLQTFTDKIRLYIAVNGEDGSDSLHHLRLRASYYQGAYNACEEMEEMERL